MKRQLVVAGLITAAGVTGIAGMGVAHAASTSTGTDPMSSLVQAVATKFNLKESDVRAVFDAQRDKMKAAREAKVKNEVAQLVTEGKITQDQANKINAKRAELQQERESAKNSGKTREQIRDEMQSKRTELENWAKQNGINTAYLRYVMGGFGHGHGPAGQGRPDGDADDTSAHN